MIYTVKEFCHYISQDRIKVLIGQILGGTGRSLGANELESYQQVAAMLEKAMKINPSIRDAHLLLEYKLPSASAWCDLVLLGSDASNHYQVLIIELKN